MAVLRVHKTSNYTVMSNYHFKEKNMTLKAKGLLSLMLSLPDNWDYSINGLVQLSKDGRDGVITALKELEDFKYLIRTRTFDELGRFNGYDYDIHEQPYTEIPNTEKPFTDKPFTEKPYTENPIQLNTKQLTTNELITKELNTNNKELNTKERKIKERNEAGASEVVSLEDTYFMEFWAAYPKKVNKQGALKSFKKIKHLRDEFKIIMAALETFKASKQWQKDNGQYIPNPTTFINQERWKDEQPETRDVVLKKINMDGWV